MVDWEFFAKRRNVDLRVWIVDLNIENYEQLEQICAQKGVHPPLLATFQAAQAQVLPTVGDLVEKEIKKDEKPQKKMPRKKTTRAPRKRVSK